MDISIIIPFANEKEELLLTIESIEKAKGKINNYEIIVINDASDDTFDYKSHLEYKANIRYYENSYRIGVAACRDIGIMLATYNKFLLLDAHMRIYNEETLPAFIDALSVNKNAIICCRTIGFGNYPKMTTPYAAYIEFFGSHGGLYAEWNSNDSSPDSSISTVPCILGAAYAACKDYWMYLRGLSGLISYGSDEAYISMKVWLSGGKCLILKNIVIGHLYRKDPPYMIKHIDYVYNKILITLLLLPNKLCLEVLDNLSNTFRVQFNYSLVKLYKNLNFYLELREYYNKILNPDLFDAFYNFNKKCELASTPVTHIDSVESFNTSTLNLDCEINFFDMKNSGLYNGKMGNAILSYLHGETSHADEQIDNIIEDVETKHMELSFDDGLLGIAWGLSFLSDNKLISCNINQLLSDFDDIIFNSFDMKYYEDWSFEKGILGLVFYSTMRLYQDSSLQLKYPIFFKFLNKLIREKYTNESSNLFDTNVPFIAFLFLCFYDEKYKIIDCITSIEALLFMSNIRISNNKSNFYKGIKLLKPTKWE